MSNQNHKWIQFPVKYLPEPITNDKCCCASFVSTVTETFGTNIFKMRTMIKEEKLSLAHVRQILEIIDIENGIKVSSVQIRYFVLVSF